MSPFSLLGLPPDADERAIKRAYAQRLRQIRPEDDAQGFQRLHEIYQAALERCRQGMPAATSAQDEGASTDREQRFDASMAQPPRIDAGVSSTAAPIAQPPPAAVVFVVDEFCSAAFDLAATGDPARLQDWLGSRPELWSLQLKAQVGHYLVQQLYQQVPPMPESCLDTLLHFFDLDHALAGHDPAALQQLRRRSRLAWELQPDHQNALAARLNMPPWRVRWNLRQLHRPFRWPQVLLIGMNPSNAGIIATFVARLAGINPEDLPDGVKRDQLQFWQAAADLKRVNRPRLILGLARSAVILLVGMLLAPLLSLAYSGGIALEPMLFVIALLMVPSMLWGVWVAWQALDHWQGRPEHLPVRWPWLCLGLVPLMCAGGLALQLTRQPGLGVLLLTPAVWLALRRYWHRHDGHGFVWKAGHVRVFFILLFLLANALRGTDLIADIPSADSAGFVLASVAMLAWGADLWKQRRHLRIAMR
jgi:hypothetical protein